MGHEFRDWIVHSSNFLCEIHSYDFLFILFLDSYCSPEPRLYQYTWLKPPAKFKFLPKVISGGKAIGLYKSTTCHLIDVSQHLKFKMSRACSDQNLFLIPIFLHSSINSVKHMLNAKHLPGSEDSITN